jgi:hypothetical protein
MCEDVGTTSGQICTLAVVCGEDTYSRSGLPLCMCTKLHTLIMVWFLCSIIWPTRTLEDLPLELLSRQQAHVWLPLWLSWKSKLTVVAYVDCTAGRALMTHGGPSTRLPCPSGMQRRSASEWVETSHVLEKEMDAAVVPQNMALLLSTEPCPAWE